MTEMFIPGSDFFNSRPLPPEELRARISPKLELHTVTDEDVADLDAATYEVIRHRFSAIVEEMGDTLRRMSGSPAVTESNDFGFTIADELGDAVLVGLYNSGMMGSLDLAVYWTLQNRSENPGIEDGDLFLCNDPWVGASLHQSDAAVLCPIFYDGKLFAWSTAVCHELDLGGTTPGSWSTKATDVFSESVPTPPLKVVRNGVLQNDVADAWVRRSRLPHLVGLDLRAKIGANQTAARRLIALVDRYGPQVVKAVMKRIMDDSERRLRTRIKGLPDGDWSSVSYIEQSNEGDRDIYAVRCKLSKRDDRLIFDFTGTDRQSGMINGPYASLRTGVIFTVLPQLAYDIPWAPGGLLRPIELITEEGTINNARFPAAVGKAPVAGAWATSNVASECVGRMLEIKPETRRDVQSICSGGFDMGVIHGMDERPAQPHPFVSVMFDAMAAGFGAQVESDGLDTGGIPLIPMGRTPDAEMTELLQPLLLVWRREETDTGGPGRTRGGVSGSLLVVAHGTSTPMALVFSGSGKASSQGTGLAGGYPGATQLDLIVRDCDVQRLLADGRIPSDPSELSGATDFIQCEAEGVLGPRDALYMRWQAGGGYGDPLQRDPAEVATDVRAGKVSVAAAFDLYGVALAAESEQVDVERTEQRRDAIREQRRRRASTIDGGFTGKPEDGAIDELRVDHNLAIVTSDGDSAICCSHCGVRLAALGDSPYAALARYEGEPREAGPHIGDDPSIYIDAPVVFRQLCCPSCWTAMSSEVIPVDHPIPSGGPDSAWLDEAQRT